MEKDNIVGKPTLVRRVSDLFNNANGKSAGSSMQKLRHCCQNLNLFPILLYSFGDSKANPMLTSKFHVCLSLILAKIIERIYRVYSSIRKTIIRGLGLDPLSPGFKAQISQKSWINEQRKEDQREARSTIVTKEDSRKFHDFTIRKPKSISLLLKIAIYIAPLILAFQLIGIFGLLILGKYTPGFVFLLSALVFLGCISMKILNHDITAVHTFKREKRKIE